MLPFTMSAVKLPAWPKAEQLYVYVAVTLPVFTRKGAELPCPLPDILIRNCGADGWASDCKIRPGCRGQSLTRSCATDASAGIGPRRIPLGSVLVVSTRCVGSRLRRPPLETSELCG